MTEQETFAAYSQKQFPQGIVITADGHLFTVSGLKGVLLNEKILLENEAIGFVFSIGQESSQIVLIKGDPPTPDIKSCQNR